MVDTVSGEEKLIGTKAVSSLTESKRHSPHDDFAPKPLSTKPRSPTREDDRKAADDKKDPSPRLLLPPLLRKESKGADHKHSSSKLAALWSPTIEKNKETDYFLPNKSSSENVRSAVDDTAKAVDNVGTIVLRWPGAEAALMGTDPSGVGPTIHWLSEQGITVQCALMLPLLGLGLLQVAYNYQKRQKEFNDKQTSHKKIQDEFKKIADQRSEEKLEQRNKEKCQVEIEQQIKYRQKLELINDRINKAIQQNSHLKQKYESAQLEITDDGVIQFKYVPTEKDETTSLATVTKKINDSAFAKKILTPIWRALNLFAGTYWYFWIFVAGFTGILTTGVAGLTPLVFLGVPALIALIYLGVKIKNYFAHAEKRKFLSENNRGEVYDDFSPLIDRAIKMQELDAAIIELGGNPIESNYSIPTYSTSSWVKSGAFEELWGVLIGLSFCSWPITDALSILWNITPAASVTEAIGATFVAISCAYAIYTYLASPPSSAPEINLDEELAKTKGTIAKLEGDLLEAKKGKEFGEKSIINKENSRENITTWEKFKTAASRIMTFLGGLQTGVFTGRIFFAAGTTAFQVLFLGALCSNPWPLGFILALGIGYAVYKLVKTYYQEKEKDQLKELQENHEKIEELGKKIEIAKLTKNAQPALVALHYPMASTESSVAKTVANDVISTLVIETAATKPLQSSIQVSHTSFSSSVADAVVSEPTDIIVATSASVATEQLRDINVSSNRFIFLSHTDSASSHAQTRARTHSEDNATINPQPSSLLEPGIRRYSFSG